MRVLTMDIPNKRLDQEEDDENGQYGLGKLTVGSLSSSGMSKKFQIEDILSDPSLAIAARHELQTGLSGLGSGSPGTGTYPPFHASNGSIPMTCLAPATEHESFQCKTKEQAEILDMDVQEESEVNCELAALVLKQLESSRSELQVLTDVLAALTSAESAYSSALSNVIRTKRSLAKTNIQPSALEQQRSNPQSPKHTSDTINTPTDSTSTAHLAIQQHDRLAGLPAALLPIHQKLHSTLQPMYDQAQKLLQHYVLACKEVRSEAQVVQRNVNTARANLQREFDEHSSACSALAAVLQARETGKRVSSPSTDPWGVERRMVLGLKALQRAQDKERSFLQTAFSNAKHLELQRIEVVGQAITSLAESYGKSLQSLQQRFQVHTGIVSQGDQEQEGVVATMMPEDEKLQELSRAAATASDATSALAARQADNVAAVHADFFTSPEIVRQGELQRWDCEHGRWAPGHAVLTRAGYLYCFNVSQDNKPTNLVGELSLAKLHFEAAQPPCFNLVQQGLLTAWTYFVGSRPQKLTFQAPSVDECCEWTIAIREAIAVACGRVAS